MAKLPHHHSEFLEQLTRHIKENLADEHFGVSELAQKVHMSRSNLLRKVKQQTGDSVSIFIRKVRLAEARQMLRDESLTVSEVAFQVGFNSTSYFTRCFREEYGYPPGEESKRNLESTEMPQSQETPSPKAKTRRWLGPVILMLLSVALTVYYIFIKKEKPVPPTALEKSIAVLPFKNDSGDTSNIYIINGLMEAILNNLQKVEDLKVISRTTVEKYRDQNKSIPELSQELQVNYFIEGSGQKIGDQILLTIQLIEAPNDKHIWSQRYERQATGIFQLQTEIALQVADAIKAIITPEERQRIEKAPTENPAAYDYYLEGLGKTDDQNQRSLLEAIDLFQKAIEADPAFAQAYGYIGICYYYLDIFQTEKQYSLEINTYADKAILLDPELAPGLIAKALYYMQDEQYPLAIQFLEKVLDYYPNDAWVHNFLSQIYANYLPDTEKYLTHAIQGIQRAALDQDSATASNSYLHLANALAQSGFIEESTPYIQQSLALNPDNVFSETVNAYIQLAKDGDAQKAKTALIHALQKDSTNLLVMQEVAKMCYFMHDYEEAWKYYEKFLQIKEYLGWDVYAAENSKIAFVLRQLGQSDEAQKYLNLYHDFLPKDESIYGNLGYASYFASTGAVDKGIEHLKAFAKAQNFQYWVVLFLEDDPIMQQMTGHPQYKATIEKINDQFWKQHQRIKKELVEVGVLPE